ncbi:MAG: WXG100 family type VII secretion target [Mycobacterium sp.]|nr:WXG100 family type VII secretion target [Mycobacterium sp.]
MSLRVNLEHLAISAAQVSGHGEDLAIAHLAADNRIADAQAGWAGRSAEALVHRASHWAANSTALVTRIGEHANNLYNIRLAFASMETGSEQELGTGALG